MLTMAKSGERGLALQAIKLALSYAVGPPPPEGLVGEEPRPELGRQTARELLAIIHGHPVDYDDPSDLPSGSPGVATGTLPPFMGVGPEAKEVEPKAAAELPPAADPGRKCFYDGVCTAFVPKDSGSPYCPAHSEAFRKWPAGNYSP